jgi:hypothetical protein
MGTVLDSNRFLSQIIYRFSLQTFLFDEPPIHPEAFTYDLHTTHAVLEGMLLLLINVVTELPLPPYEDPSERTRILLRREIVHLLISGPSPYSDLQNLMQICVPESERAKSSVLDDVIAAVGDWQEGTSLEPSKVKLKEKAWLEYDSSFPHAVHRSHQKAHENRPKVKSAQPYAPQMPPSHPQFTCFRVTFLSNESLWDVLRMTMLSYLSIRDPKQAHRSYDLHKYQLMACPISVFTMSLHLLTLVIHSLFSSEVPSVNLQGLDEKTYDPSFRKAQFADYLNEPIDLLPRGEDCLEVDKCPSFVEILMDLYEYFGGGDDPTKHWIFWILSKITELSSECDRVVGERLRQQLDEKRAQELLERRNKARERAMQSMKKNAAAFETLIGNEPEEYLEDEEEAAAGDATGGCDVECIVCRSKDSTDILGYIGYTQASKFLHHDPHPALHTISVPEKPDLDLHVQVPLPAPVLCLP